MKTTRRFLREGEELSDIINDADIKKIDKAIGELIDRECKNVLGMSVPDDWLLKGAANPGPPKFRSVYGMVFHS